LTLHSSLLK